MIDRQGRVTSRFFGDYATSDPQCPYRLPDARISPGTPTTGLLRVSAAGGERTVLTKPDRARLTNASSRAGQIVPSCMPPAESARKPPRTHLANLVLVMNWFEELKRLVPTN